MEIEIPIFFLNDETEKFKSVGMSYDLAKNTVRMITFYHIDAIYPYYPEEGGYEYCSVMVGGDEFISPCTYAELKELIRNYKIHAN